MVNKNKYSIPAILKKSVKFLGNTISDSLSDKHQVDNLFWSLNKSLAIINVNIKSKGPSQKLLYIKNPFYECKKKPTKKNC